MLERCRLHFLDRLADCRRALVLGDGDGRFLAALMAQNASRNADAVDTSAAMLRLLRERCRKATSSSDMSAELRLRIHHSDALSYLSASSDVSSHNGAYDLVVTHFFLDCLTQPELEALATAIAAKLTPGALWVVSDFRIPEGPMRLPARLLVSGLYLAFRTFTGLRTNKLPDHPGVLARTGFTCMSKRTFLFGALTSELWSKEVRPTAA